MTEDWKTRANSKREAVMQAIPAKWRLKDVPDVDTLPNCLDFVADQLNEEERRITDMELEPLIEALATRKYTSRTVTEAFAHRAAIAHQLVCSVILLYRLNA